MTSKRDFSGLCALVLTVVVVIVAARVLPCLGSSYAEGVGYACWWDGIREVPFPDEDINRYVGRVIDWSVFLELIRLVDERYPGHGVTVYFKSIEAEWVDLGGDTWEGRFDKVLLISFLDRGPC